MSKALPGSSKTFDDVMTSVTSSCVLGSVRVEKK